MGRDDRDKLADRRGARQRADPAHARARRRASTGVWLIGGTLPLRGSDAAIACATPACVYAPDGSLAARYDKIHLFRFDNGREHYDEGARDRGRQRSRCAFDAPAGAARPERLLRPALSRAVPGADAAAVRPAHRAVGVHPHHRQGALGTAAARARDREPVLRDRAGAGRHARERPPHLRPQHGRRSVGRSRRGPAPKARAWCWPSSMPNASPRCAGNCRRCSTGAGCLQRLSNRPPIGLGMCGPRTRTHEGPSQPSHRFRGSRGTDCRRRRRRPECLG